MSEWTCFNNSLAKRVGVDAAIVLSVCREAIDHESKERGVEETWDVTVKFDMQDILDQFGYFDIDDKGVHMAVASAFAVLSGEELLSFRWEHDENGPSSVLVWYTWEQFLNYLKGYVLQPAC